MKRVFLLLVLCISLTGLSQSFNNSSTLSFGFQYKPIIPANIFGSGKFTIENGPLIGTIAPKFGHSFGAVVRAQFTKLIALETGINYVKRNYNLTWDIADSSIQQLGDVGVVSYDIPVNALIFVRLHEKFYMNASIGVSMMLFASDVHTGHSLGLNERVLFEGRRLGMVQGALNANVGFEYRTKKAGSIYLGASFKLPFAPIMDVGMDYKNDDYSTVAYGKLRGSYLTLDLRYFFKPVVIKRNKKKKKKQKLEDLGPIDQ